MVWPLPRPWSESPSEQCKPYKRRVFCVWSALYIWISSRRPRSVRGWGRPLFAEIVRTNFDWIPPVYTVINSHMGWLVKTRSQKELHSSHKFVPMIIFLGSSQGDWNLSKICPRIEKHFRTNFVDKFQSLLLETWGETIVGTNFGQIWGLGRFWLL